MINSNTQLWRVDPSTLPAFNPSGKKVRKIGCGPLINLPALQVLLNSADFDLDTLWVATDRCELDLESYRWTYEDVVHMLVCLKAGDFDKSEWCQVKGGSVLPCDVYVMPYDETRRQRSAKGLEVYMKFSIDSTGALSLVLVSCHPSR